MPKTKVPKPAQIVKCPYCEHTGSARGLFTHTRLAHPHSPLIKTKAANPYSITPSSPSLFHRNEKYMNFDGKGVGTIKKKQRHRGISENEQLEAVGWTILVGTIIKLVQDWTTKQTLLSGADKPKAAVIGKVGIAKAID